MVNLSVTDPGDRAASGAGGGRGGRERGPGFSHHPGRGDQGLRQQEWLSTGQEGHHHFRSAGGEEGKVSHSPQSPTYARPGETNQEYAVAPSGELVTTQFSQVGERICKHKGCIFYSCIIVWFCCATELDFHRY